MLLVPGSDRIIADSSSDPVTGVVRFAPAKSIWIGSMTLAALILCPLFVTPSLG